MTKARTNGAKKAAKRAQSVTGGVCAMSGAVIAAAPVSPPEAQMRRDHEVSGGQGTPRIIRYRDASPLDRALARRVITKRQHDAGDAFEALYMAMGGSRGPRSCLDWTPRGNGGLVTQNVIDATRKWRELTQRLGITHGAIVTQTVIDWEQIGRTDAKRFMALIEGLNVVADFFGLATE